MILRLFVSLLADLGRRRIVAFADRAMHQSLNLLRIQKFLKVLSSKVMLNIQRLVAGHHFSNSIILDEYYERYQYAKTARVDHGRRKKEVERRKKQIE